LRPEITWIENFNFRLTQAGDQAPDLGSVKGKPRLLAPMAAMLAERRGKMSLSPLATRSLLDTVGARLDESRDISRYLIGLLIFLGLLGTFWGLLQTISAVGGAISSLSVESGDFATLFSDLQAGLLAPLAGMGTAFSSSLFGLAGSLVLGFLDLQASQAQNRFYNDLEDWLSSATRLSSGVSVGTADMSIPAYMEALLERSVEGLENLQRAFQRSEEGRMSTNESVVALSERLATLTDQMRAEQNLMVKLAQSQVEIKPVLDRLAASLERQDATGGGGLDDSSRNHLRNVDVLLTRMFEDNWKGRQQLIDELRAEMKLLTRTIAGVRDRDRPEG
ncbi:MAG: flagellar motor protein MotA, partial [Rhodospirillales bacterium]|nr:flagellar motor protein MotA [Rhodospirillales bacterium]